jgi:RNA polymerase sigma factor (sigma-70 family)
MNLLSPWRRGAPEDHHERIFVERLGTVMQWARQIAGGDASLAEDLAQDAFLHFTAGKPSLEEISNIDKYLYVVLKNLFRSHLAAVNRRCAIPLDPLAHESAMQTWRSVDPERRLLLREELRRICTFVCERKETSKGASAFLLRFFHGLSPSEVSAAMQTTRAAVDERLSVVRKEVRRHLGRQTPLLVKSTSAEPMAELQLMIAASCCGQCFSADEAQRSYAPRAAELARDRLAHLASCKKCLSLVAQLLQFPTDSGSSPPAASTGGDRVSRWKHKRDELWLTEPTELRLIVNGHLLATERVHLPDNQLSISIALHEPVEFVEIWSGENTRLLFLPGISEPPDGKCDQRASIDLSTGSLQFVLRFQEPWPTVAVSYTARKSEGLAQVREHAATSLICLPFQREITPRSRFSGLLSLPTLSATIALVLIVVLLFVQTRETTLSAAEVLDRAGKWEQGVTTTQAPVLHRRFSLIKQNKGVTVEHTFVEVWRRAGFDGKLSRWTDASGRTLAQGRIALSAPVRVEQANIWKFEPSVEAFKVAAGPLEHAAVSNTIERTTIRVPLGELVLDRMTDRPIEERFSIDAAEYVFTEAFTETIPLAASPLSPPPPETRPAEKRNRAANESNRPNLQPARPDFLIEEREMQVRKELHALQLATAASITTRESAIDVQFAPTTVEQEGMLRTALENIPGVNVSIISTKAAVLNSVTANGPSSALPATERPGGPLAAEWLKSGLGSESEVRAEEERRLQTARHLVTLVAEWRLLPSGIRPAWNHI